MARASSEIVKKNPKLESFLHRSLSSEAYDRVRGYESCICVSEKENKAFKYIVLSDEWIYLTENPPKAIKGVVHLRDVVNIELVNDLPEFLRREEQQRDTQHIAITHLTCEPTQRRSLRRGKPRSPRGSLTDLGDRSNSSTPLGYASSLDGSEDVGYFTQSAASLQHSRPTSRGSVGSQREVGASVRGSMTKKKKKPSHHHHHHQPPPISEDWEQDSILRSLKEEIDESNLEDIEDDRMSDLPSSRTLDRSLRVGGGSIGDSRGGKVGFETSASQELHSLRNNPQTMRSVNSLSASQTSVRPLPSQPKTGGALVPTLIMHGEMQKVDDAGVVLKPVEVTSKSGCSCAPFFCRKSSKSQVSPTFKNENALDTGAFNGKKNLVCDSKSTIPTVAVSSMSDEVCESRDGRDSRSSRHSSLMGGGPPAVGSRSGTPSFEADRLGSFLSSEVSGSINGLQLLSADSSSPESRLTVLHIYLLSCSSPMMMLMRGAWSNYLIRATLALEGESPNISLILSNNNSQREKCDLLFNQLKQQLFDTSNSMVVYYQLFASLMQNTEKNFLMKKLFWRNGDLFVLVVQQLQRYMPHTAADLHTENGRCQRVDELKYVVLLVKLISLMFRESEILSSRMQALKTERGRFVIDLLMTLTSSLNMPEKQILLMKHWTAPSKHSRLGSSGNISRDSELQEEHLYQLLSDYIRVSITAVFELFLMAKQNPFEQDGSLHFTVGWMVKIMDECKNTEQFVERVMSQVLEVINLARFGAVSSQQAVCLYQQFTVLLAVLDHNTSVLDFLGSHYHEEFKYFIQGPHLARKLPAHFPITVVMLRVVNKVSGKVLGNSPKTSARK